MGRFRIYGKTLIQYNMTNVTVKDLKYLLNFDTDKAFATICANCGKEKYLHTIGEGVKASKIIIYSSK